MNDLRFKILFHVICLNIKTPQKKKQKKNSSLNTSHMETIIYYKVYGTSRPVLIVTERVHPIPTATNTE